MRHSWFLLLFLVLTSSALAQRWSDKIAAELRTAKVVEMKALSQALSDWDGSNEYYLVTLEGGRKAVFRSEDEPWGSLAEVAGYRIDQRLKTDLVPPTVERTLRADEVSGSWPWPKLKERPGSLQLFVEGARHAQPEDLNQPDRANSEILCFVLGRYDNHAGNLLVDPAGRLVLVDFEGALDMQKVRYGDFPFIRRGGWYESPLSIPASEPFPYENPSCLVDPSLEEIQETFGPWWGQYWAQGMVGLHALLRGIPERTIPYVIWNNRLWVQVRVQSRHPAYTEVYPSTTMQALESLTLQEIGSLLGPPFQKAHARAILGRIRQLQVASKLEAESSGAGPQPLAR